MVDASYFFSFPARFYVAFYPFVNIADRSKHVALISMQNYWVRCYSGVFPVVMWHLIRRRVRLYSHYFPCDISHSQALKLKRSFPLLVDLLENWHLLLKLLKMLKYPRAKSREMSWNVFNVSEQWNQLSIVSACQLKLQKALLPPTFLCEHSSMYHLMKHCQ